MKEHRVDREGATLVVVPLGGRRYHVSGGAEGHWLDLEATDPCDCGWWLWRGTACKHIRAALQHEREAA